MIRATTPTHSFIFSVDPEQFVKILVTYAQKDRIILEKTEEDMTFVKGQLCDGSERWVASYRLSQEEANLFHTYYDKSVNIQVRALTNDDTVYASDIKRIPLKDVLNDEVLTNGI